MWKNARHSDSKKVQFRHLRYCRYVVVLLFVATSTIVWSRKNFCLFLEGTSSVGLRAKDGFNQSAGFSQQPNTTTLLPRIARPYEHNQTDCIQIRGMYGRWEEDLDYASKVQYTTYEGSFHQRAFLERKRNGKARRDFLPFTTYAWRETMYPECQLQILTAEGFCRVLSQLNISTLMLVGDSLTGQMQASLAGLMQFPESEQRNETHFCPDGFQFRIVGFRDLVYAIDKPAEAFMVNKSSTNKLGTDTLPIVEGYGQATIFYCQREGTLEKGQPGLCGWHEYYHKIKEGQVLLVLNGGPHYHARKAFQAMLDGFLSTFRMRSPDDLIWFRTTAPGHKDCFHIPDGQSGRNAPPISNYSTFQRLYEASRFGWNQFQYFNSYAEETLRNTSIRLLNIHNMTALRPDGHPSATDCLHYSLPSVIDWWNHLLYSNLLDLANRTGGALSRVK
jgi:hypothetical protein